MNNALMPFQTQDFFKANLVISRDGSIQLYQHNHSDLMGDIQLVLKQFPEFILNMPNENTCVLKGTLTTLKGNRISTTINIPQNYPHSTPEALVCLKDTTSYTETYREGSEWEVENHDLISFITNLVNWLNKKACKL